MGKGKLFFSKSFPFPMPIPFQKLGVFVPGVGGIEIGWISMNSILSYNQDFIFRIDIA